MGAYSSYYLYQKFEKRGDQDWIPCTPNVYSISGDSTIPMPLVEKSSADTECGYVPKGSDDYNYEKWEVVPNDYICDDTTKYAKERKYVSDDNVNWIATDIYRRSNTVLALNSTDCGYDSQWDNYNCSKWEPSGTICNEGNKYERERKYFRQCEDCQDCSAEWIASNIYRQGGLITYDSVDCGYVIGERMYRWVDLDPSTDYYCSGSTKYYKQQKEVSYNQGQTWQSVSPAEYRQGKFIENSSADCGGSEPIYQWNLVSGYICDDCENVKLSVGVSANTYALECSGSTALTSADVQGLTSKTLIEWATIGNCVETIDTNAFSGCSAMEFVRIPNSVKTIGESAFRSCSAMTECSLPSGIQTIGNSAFTNSISLAFINLPDGVTSVGDAAFRGCKNFRYINIPNSLTSISNYCFYDCDGMTDIELHSVITAIGNSAFENCSGIYSITLHSTIPPTLGTNALNGTNTNLKIYVPSASVDTYKAASGWSSYANKIYAIQ
jgi:hypothetical protein